ncbi:helix-turn-helix domain-containing protein [Sporosarcina sp. FSL W8-0480]|uniref:helix-turn-helix domain-containing protein n=1 Tax=Sporosarcina sp. FSL W8-0480 TaxID=2954701 RepID=UPI0030DD11E0
MENMSDPVRDYKLQKPGDEQYTSQNTEEFVKLTMLQEELVREKKRLYQVLTESEKKDAFEIISKKYNIPDHITVREASEILEISPQMVRRHCTEGKIRSYQTLQGSGKWRIEAEQFMNYPNWGKFIEKRGRIKKQSENIAKKMLDYLEDEE